MKWADFTVESELWDKGYTSIAGVDEVGRGSWVGPVVAAAVIFPVNFKPEFQLADSKLLSSIKRVELDKLIRQHATSLSISEVSQEVIDQVGIAEAAQQAFRSALLGLNIKPDFTLVDAFYIKRVAKSRQRPIIRGDQLSASIAAASIVGKVYRDNLMVELGKKYPSYGFSRHKGYGTKFHQGAIRSYGYTPLHRRSFDLTFLSN